MQGTQNSAAGESTAFRGNNCGTQGITVMLRCAGILHIEKDGKELYKFYYTSDVDGVTTHRSIGGMRSRCLKKAMPFFSFRLAVIETKIGELVVRDTGETKKLKDWIKNQE